MRARRDCHHPTLTRAARTEFATGAVSRRKTGRLTGHLSRGPAGPAFRTLAMVGCHVAREVLMSSESEIERESRDEFDNSFDVPLPPAEAWVVLTDIRRVAPCMPGVELTEVVDEKTYQGRISLHLGPVPLAFEGAVKLEELDPVDHKARVKAQGIDAKDRGGANATASFRLEPAGGGCKVLVHTDLVMSGAVAQYGRGVGLIQATAAQIMKQFAANLQAEIAGSRKA